MKKVYFLLMITVLSIMAFSPGGGIVGKQFPSLTCEDYTGKQVVLPESAKDKFTVVGMAFSNDAEKDLKTWIDPLYNTFAPKKEKAEADPFDVASANYEANLFFIPRFSKANQLVKSTKDKIKKDTSEDMYGMLLFYVGSKALNEELAVDDKNVPYIFVLDKTGKIIYVTSGVFDTKKQESIIDLVSE